MLLVHIGSLYPASIQRPGDVPSSDINDVIRAVFFVFTIRFHKHKTTYSEQK